METPVYWIDGPWPGRLAILSRPRGSDWLEDEVRAWKREGIDIAVSMLIPDEVDEWELKSEGDLCTEQGIEFVSMGVPDRGVPTDNAMAGALIKRLEAALGQGKNVGVHCRAGLGRSPLLAAGILVAGGLDEDAAFERIAAARGCPVPETPEQREWVSRYAEGVLAKN